MIEPVFADVSTGFTQGVGNVEGEVIAAGLDGGVQQQVVLLLCQVLVQVDMACAAAVQVAGKRPAVQLELVEDVDGGVFHAEEVAVVAVAGDKQLVLAIPCGVLDAEIFGGHHFCVPKDAGASGGTIGLIDRLENGLGISDILRVSGVRPDAQRFRAFKEAVDADGKILLFRRDKARVVDRQ